VWSNVQELCCVPAQKGEGNDFICRVPTQEYLTVKSSRELKLSFVAYISVIFMACEMIQILVT